MPRATPALAAALLVLTLAGPGCAPLTHDRSAGTMVRTELYLGLSTKGAEVTDREFASFLDEVVTPAFPGGYTVLTGEGRWRDAAAGRTVREDTRVIVILRPPTRETSEKIDTIRREYAKRFDQQATLRTDAKAKVVCD